MEFTYQASSLVCSFVYLSRRKPLQTVEHQPSSAVEESRKETSISDVSLSGSSKELQKSSVRSNRLSVLREQWVHCTDQAGHKPKDLGLSHLAKSPGNTRADKTTPIYPHSATPNSSTGYRCTSRIALPQRNKPAEEVQKTCWAQDPAHRTTASTIHSSTECLLPCNNGNYFAETGASQGNASNTPNPLAYHITCLGATATPRRFGSSNADSRSTTNPDRTLH